MVQGVNYMILVNKNKDFMMVVALSKGNNLSDEEISKKLGTLKHCINGVYVVDKAVTYPIMSDNELLNVLDSKLWEFCFVDTDKLRKKLSA